MLFPVDKVSLFNVSTTEYYLVAGTTTPTWGAGTFVGPAENVSFSIDRSNMAAGDVFRFRVYNRVATGTPQVIYESTWMGKQSNAFVTPIISAEACDVSLLKLSGTDRQFNMTYFYDDGNANVTEWNGTVVTLVSIPADVTEWNGTVVATPAVAGVPKVEVSTIDASAITATSIASGAITSAKIASGAITSSQIAASAIGASQIASAALTSAKFDNTVNIQITRTATAQAGAASSITLDASASATNSLYSGSQVYIVSGTGAGQTRVITAYVGSTKVATVDSAWATNPDATSVFQIIPFESTSSGGTVNANVIQWNGSTPNALVSGRVDSSVGAMAAGVLTAAATATNFFDAIWNYVTEGSTTAVQMMRGFAAALFNKAAGFSGSTRTFRDIGDTKDRISASVDATGRTAVTLNLT